MPQRKLFAVIGDPVAHSLSPAMHNAAFRAAGKDAEYTAIRVQPEHVPDFFAEARKRLAGFNVTVPHKAAAFQLADIADEEAKLCGSVNTIRVEDGGEHLAGYTTDGYGFERAVREAFDLSLAGADLCLIGCGGAAHAIAWHAASSGARSLRILNRTVEKAQTLCEAVKAHFPNILCEWASIADRDKTARFLAESRLAVQCTSVGLHEGDPAPVDPELFPPNGIFFFDMIYRRNALQMSLEERGIPVQDGLPMLLYQGVRSYEIWFEEPAPVDVMRDALTNAIRQRQE